MVIALSICSEHNVKVSQVTEIEIKLILSSPKFTKQHAYCHKSIESCLFHMLHEHSHHPNSSSSTSNTGMYNSQTNSNNNNNNDILWAGRTDISLSAEVFYIENKVSFSKEIDIFCLFILTSYSDFGKKHNISSKLQQCIEQFGNNSSSMQIELIRMLETKLSCKGITIKSNQIMSSTTKSMIGGKGRAISSAIELGTKSVGQLPLTNTNETEAILIVEIDDEDIDGMDDINKIKRIENDFDETPGMVIERGGSSLLGQEGIAERQASEGVEKVKYNIMTSNTDDGERWEW